MARIKHARVSFVSFVPEGATLLHGLYKGSQGLEMTPLMKDDRFEDLGQLTSAVYIPEHPDAHGHVASAEVIQKMAHSFMEEGARLDIKHNRKELKKSQAYVAESFVIQKNDPRFEGLKDHLGKAIDPTGGWGIITQIVDDDLKKAYRDKEWNGVSLFSYHGDFELEEESDPVAKALEDFQRRLNSSDEIEMDTKELADLLKENNEQLIAALKPAEPAKPVVEPGGAEDGAPLFKGDFTDLDALKKHQGELAQYELRKKYDFNKPEDLQKFINELEELKQKPENSRSADEKGSGADDSGSETLSKESDSEAVNALNARIEDLQKQVNKKRKQSNVLEKDLETVYDTEGSTLSKELQDAWAVGEEIGKIANKKRGFE